MISGGAFRHFVDMTCPRNLPRLFKHKTVVIANGNNNNSSSNVASDSYRV